MSADFDIEGAEKLGHLPKDFAPHTALQEPSACLCHAGSSTATRPQASTGAVRNLGKSHAEQEVGGETRPHEQENQSSGRASRDARSA